VSFEGASIDDRVGAFLDRPLTGDWPYLGLDATYLNPDFPDDLFMR